MEVNQVEFEEAIRDFVLGKGRGSPNPTHCEILMKYHSTINTLIMEAFIQKI